MPNYDYMCSKCNTVFERYLKMSDRKHPESEPCPTCNEMSVQQTIAFTSLPMSATMESAKAIRKLNSSAFAEKMNQIHQNTPGSNMNKASTYVDIK